MPTPTNIFDPNPSSTLSWRKNSKSRKAKTHQTYENFKSTKKPRGRTLPNTTEPGLASTSNCFDRGPAIVKNTQKWRRVVTTNNDNQKTSSFESFKNRHRDWQNRCGACIISADNKSCLLVKQREAQKWSLPKGSKELVSHGKEEENWQCMKRELMEETGIMIDKYEFDTLETYYKFHCHIFVFRLKCDISSIVLCPKDHEEIETIEWVSIQDTENRSLNRITQDCLDYLKTRNIFTQPEKVAEVLPLTPVVEDSMSVVNDDISVDSPMVICDNISPEMTNCKRPDRQAPDTQLMKLLRAPDMQMMTPFDILCYISLFCICMLCMEQ
jgi:8-oxo-dGTP pyrophosphatase MutT (NUDIX family)